MVCSIANIIQENKFKSIEIMTGNVCTVTVFSAIAAKYTRHWVSAVAHTYTRYSNHASSCLHNGDVYFTFYTCSFIQSSAMA